MKRLIFVLLLPLFANGQVRNLVAQFPINEAVKENLDDGILGRWKFEEDTNKKNFYEVIRREPYMMDRYHIKFWDHGGTNPTYESNMHFSKVGNAWFINMPYFEHGFTHSGFFFLKILEKSTDFTSFTAAIVGDVTLWNLSQEEVTERITKNVNNPAFYQDTVHFYKVQ